MKGKLGKFLNKKKNATGKGEGETKPEEIKKTAEQ
jgi:hypothetical protein